MTGFAGAIQFLTRVPIRTRQAVPHERVLPWFPIVGALIGLAVGAVAVGLIEFVPPAVAATTAVIVGMLITGAFHEDGLADVADAFGGGWTREQRFEILKDSRHGTYGVAALTGSIVLRVVAVASIPTQAAVLAGLVAAHTLGRAAPLVAMLTVPPASESGLGADAARSLRRGPVALGLISSLVVTTLAVGWWAVPLVAAALAGTAAIAWLAVRKIGGLAGDVLGATEQVVECLVLVVVTGLASRYRLWWD